MILTLVHTSLIDAIKMDKLPRLLTTGSVQSRVINAL